MIEIGSDRMQKLDKINEGEQQQDDPVDFFKYEHKEPQKKQRKEDEETERERSIRQVTQSLGFQIFITFLALYSLFSDDIRMAAFDSSADLGFDILHIILIVIFLVEITLSWYSLPGYKLSFFFFLDLISSFSLLLDISMITQQMYSSNNSSYNLNQLAAQSRASRVATRAVRIVKLIRIIRIIKMYKAASQAAGIKEQLKKKKLIETLKRQQTRNQGTGQKTERFDKRSETKTHKNQPEALQMTNMHFMEKKQPRTPEKPSAMNEKQSQFILDADLIEAINQKQSKISKVLSDLTIKKIVIVVLLIMFLAPLFDSDNYIQSEQAWDYTVKNIQEILMNPNITVSSIDNFISETLADRSEQNKQNYVIFFSSPFEQFPQLNHQRFGEQRAQDVTVSFQQINSSIILGLRADLTLRSDLEELYEDKIYAAVNYHAKNQKQAIFSMAKTIFVCIVLMGMLHFFTQDINQLIVIPTENMMNHVMEIARNPESAANSEVDNNQYETTIVHNAILKIGALLSLVFGSAGAQIIGSNIMKQGDMDPMIGGKKKCAVFGFCDIRNFTEITQVLQEDIMLFVNKIGALVHSSVYRYGGSANKNIGEAFLLVWQLPDDTYKINNKTNEILWKRKEHVSMMCDFSVFSFVKAIVKIHKDPDVLDYRNDERLKNAFGGSYSVKMGFGIHIGWAIEGAVGSEYKIDASYLSPNVNMASRLEAATRQYGVHFLISENVYDLLTESLKIYCRYIDRVTVKGSAKPIKLYTVDLNLQNITPPADKTKKYKNPSDCLDVEIKKQINMENFNEENIQKYNAEDFIFNKKELREVMVNAMPDDFYKRFELGLNCYLKGKWADSRLHLTNALKVGKNDGPTKNILNYMKNFDFVAPETWQNYRPLTSK